MTPRVSLLSAIVALCLCHVISRGIQEQKTFSVNLEVVRPMYDCLEMRDNKNPNYNTSDCDVYLMEPKNVILENINNIRYTLKVKIGSEKQEFKVKIDTGSSVLWVFGTECDDSDDLCKGHTKYKSADSDTFKEIDKTFEITYGIGKVEGITSEDTVYLADGLEAKKQLFGAAGKVTKKYGGYDGILGLNLKKTKGYTGVFTTAAKAADMAPIFGVFIKGGGSSADGGEITFGGVKKAHFKEDTKLEIKVIGDTLFTVQMDEVKFGDTSFCTKAGDMTCKASIDTGCSLIVGPKDLINAFNKDVLGGTGAGMKKEVKCDDVDNFPDIKIKFGDDTIVIEPKFYIKTIGDKCYSTLYGMKDIWLLGDPFLIKFYSVYNLKDGDPSVTLYVAE